MNYNNMKAELCDRLAVTLSDLSDSRVIPEDMAEEVDMLLNEYIDLIDQQADAAIREYEMKLELELKGNVPTN